MTNQCRACGQWAGRGHQCPTPALQTPVTTPPVPATPAAYRSDVAARVARATATPVTPDALDYINTLTLNQARTLAANHGTDLDPTLHGWSMADVEGSTVPRYLDAGDDTIHAGDALIITDFNDGRGPCLLMIERQKAPFNGGWALPGGKLDAGETLSETIDREMTEEVQVTPEQTRNSRLLGDEVYSDTWDPRYPHAHVAAKVYEVDSDLSFEAADDAAAAQWVPIETLASGKETLAFGHANWLARLHQPGSPYANPTRYQQFAALAVAARERHHTLAQHINPIRVQGGYTPIPTGQ